MATDSAREEQRRKTILALLGVNDMMAYFHQWLDAEYQYFLRQGYTPGQARAMAAAGYTTVFGAKLPSWEAPQDGEGEMKP